MTKLTSIGINELAAREKIYRVYESGGLFLQVHPNGSKYFRFKYSFGNKQKVLALGVFPVLSLREARAACAAAKALITKGIDPVDNKLQKRMDLKAQGTTFADVYQNWWAVKMKDKSQSHQKRTQRLFEKYIHPQLGNMGINSITTPIIMEGLRTIEKKGFIETAHKTKQIISQVLRFCVISGHISNNPAADIQGALAAVKVTHYPAITEPEALGKYLNAIDIYSGGHLVTAALSLMPLLFVRPGELRHMLWEELDHAKNIWTIPAEKMKTRQDHIVPLCTQASALIESMRPISYKSAYVFASLRASGRPISDNTIRIAMRAMGYSNKQLTPHGFRATARTMLDEQLKYPFHLIEHQLAHAVRDANGRAYNRTQHLPQRIKMMQHWGDYLDELKKQADFN